MLKKTLTALLSVLAIAVAMPQWGVSAQPSSKTAHSSERAGSAVATSPATGTLQKMIVENGSVTLDLDLNGLNGDSSLVARPVTLQFAAAANSFFPIVVFNDLLRAAEPGSIRLLQGDGGEDGLSYDNLPATLSASLEQLVVEKLPSGQGFDLAVRDGNTGFTFFNVKGGDYVYDASARSLSITGGRLLISKEFANALGRPADAGSIVGRISVGAAMQPIEITRLDENGDVKSASLPALNRPGVGTVPGPDVIVGELIGLEQSDAGAVNGQVGLALGTDACNKGTENVEWIAEPDNRHPFIPQNLYRMSGGAENTERFEQIGQSWGKHAFAAASSDTCGFGCNGIGGDHLGSGCSDAYGAFLNGFQDGIGSRAWVNPFTGNFPANFAADDHTGHVHDVTSHRILVETSDLIPAQNTGATYFAEAQYVVPHEYTWCQAHPGQCNMFNNVSYQQQSVSGGPTNFNFSPAGSTVREQPGIMAWTGATVSDPLEPDPGNDGIFFVGYKVTGPNAGVWHYEYAVYNQNLDRAIQSFEVVYPLFPPPLSNAGFHAPPQHPGFAQDGTQNNEGFSDTPWIFTKNSTSATWNCETFAQNQNANAIRFGTLYNFRFDSTAPPAGTAANIGFFKTGSPISVTVLAPAQSDETPTPPPVTPTPTPTVTPTVTPPPSPTPTPSEPPPSPTPRATPRPRPTPHARR
jgi:hypothetical protein